MNVAGALNFDSSVYLQWRTLSFAASDLHRGHDFASPDGTFSRDFHNSDVQDHYADDPVVSGNAWPRVHAVPNMLSPP